METLADKRLVVVWFVLVAISLLYLWIDHSASGSGVLTASTAVTVSAICLALVKVRVIMREFMEVRHAPQLLRRLTDAWILLMAAALLGSYIVGKVVA